MKALVYLLFTLLKQGVTQCNYYNYYVDPNLVGVTIEHYNLDLENIEPIGVGFWISYRPLNNVDLAGIMYNKIENPLGSSGSNQFFVFQFKPFDLETFSLGFYIEIKELIITHYMILGMKNGIQTLDWSVSEPNLYEGSWVFVYSFIDRENSEIILNYYYQDQIQKQIVTGVPFLQENMISLTGGYQNLKISDSQTLYLQTFPGLILPVIVRRYDYLNPLNDFLDYCPPVDNCFRNDEETLVSYNKQMAGNYIFVESNIKQQSYTLQGWIKQDKLLNSQQSEAILLRISGIKQYLDNEQIGDRLLYVKYYQNMIKKEKSGFVIQTYSYENPWLPQHYQSDQSDQITVLGEKYGDLITKWHYFQFEFGTNTNNGQPIYIVYYSGIDIIEQYQWSKQINHFTISKLYFSIGGDKYLINQFYGYLSGWVFTNLCGSDSVPFQPVCDITCQQCNGISSSDCTSCNEDNFRVYSESSHSCKCKYGYIHIATLAQCLELHEYHGAFEVQEQEIIILQKGYQSSYPNKIQCDFGFFQYNDQCIEWYQNHYFSPYAPQDNVLLCADCILHPEIFGEKLNCTFKFVSSQESLVLMYTPLSNEEVELYQISSTSEQYQISLIKGLLEKGICQNGYYLISDYECIYCANNCMECRTSTKCFICKLGYQLDDLSQCVQCDSCALIFEYQTDEGTAEAYYCKPQMYISDVSCINCGSYCQECAENSGQCYHCVDNQKYFITLDSFNCAQCQIDNCIYCFQYYIKDDLGIVISFDVNVNENLQYAEIITACALCENNYYYSFITQKCELLPIDMVDCQFGVQDTNIKCIISDIRTDSIQQSICQGSYCQSCINNYSNRIQSFCIKCNDGFYSSFYTGECIRCPKECLTCAEFNTMYNDDWKWNIRPFYYYFMGNKHTFENNQGSNQIIACLSCPQNQILDDYICKENCSDDCTKCTKYIQSDDFTIHFQCNICLPDAFNPQRSIVPNKSNVCLTCPDYCSACLPRSSDQITALNPFFDQSWKFLKYSHICLINPTFLMPTICQQFDKCEKTIKLSFYLYCDPQSYFEAQDSEFDEIELDKIQFFYYIIYYNGFQYHETQEMFEFLNQQKITEITYNLEMIRFPGDALCSIINDNYNISNIWKRNVFMLQTVHLYLWKSQKSTETKLPILIMAQIFSIQNFDKITFEEIQFRTYEVENDNSRRIAQIQLLNDYDPITIIFKNCQIFSMFQEFATQYTFICQKPKQFLIDFMTFDFINIQNSAIFDFQPLKSYDYLQLTKSLYINNSLFENTSIFYYNAQQYSLNQVLNFTNVTIMNCNFSTSFFINSSFQFDYTIGEFHLENFYLENLIVQNSSILFNILNAQILTIKNLSIVNVQFLDQSSLLVCNLMNIEDLFIFNSIINYGYFIDIHSQTSTKKQNIINIVLQKMRYINNTYLSSKQFIRILKDKFTSYNFLCTDLFLQNNNLQNIQIGKKSFSQVSYQQSLIYVECQQCQLINVIIYRGIGLPEISIIDSEQLILNKFRIETKNQYQKIHSSVECLKRFIYLDYPFVLYIQSYQNVELDNIVVQNTLVIDYSLIYFSGKSLIENIETDIISIKNSIFKNNLLLAANENKQSSILQFETQQKSFININFVEFHNNLLNQYYLSSLQHSSSSLLINAEQGSINLQYTSFINNSITNSSDSVLYIWAQSVVINFCDFQNQNLVQEVLTNYLISKNSTILYTDILNQFQILANGGSGYLKANQINIKNTNVQNSTAINGGGFYIVTQEDGVLSIENCVFKNTKTLLNGDQLASGGSLYIDSSQSLLNITIQNSQIQVSYARTQGGAIYIEPSKSFNYINLDNLVIKSVFSIQHSFFSFSPTKYITIESRIIISNTLFENTEEEFLKYAQQLTNLQDQNLVIFQTDNPLIYAQFSILSMVGCQFHNMHLASVLQVEQGISIGLQKLQILNSTILQSPILKLNLRIDTQGTILLQSVIIVNISEFSFINKYSCNSISTQQHTLLCPQLSNDINLKPQIINDPNVMQNQLSCNLNQFYTIIQHQSYSTLDLSNLKNHHSLNIKDLEMSQISCTGCEYGILTIQEFDDEFKIKLINIQLIKNDCGLLGCLSIIQSVGKINLLQTSSSLVNQTLNFKISLTDSIFIDNQASYGGACFFNKINILINNTLFQGNKAMMFGGSIYSDQTSLLLINSQIILNTALIGGGLYVKEQQLQRIDKLNLILKENEGTSFASNLFEIPRAIYLSLDQINPLENVKIFSNSTMIIEQIKINPYQTYFSKQLSDVLLLPSGISISSYKYFNPETNLYISFNQSFRLIVKNAFREKIENLENSKCNISAFIQDKLNPISLKDLNIRSITQLQFISKTSITFDLKTGDYNLDDLIIYFNPYQNSNLQLQLAFSCDSIQIPYYNSSFYQPDKIINNYVLFLNLRTFECQLGEYFNETSGGCVLCDIQQSQYSVTINQSSCSYKDETKILDIQSLFHLCSYKDETKILDIQSATIQLRPNYWRAYYYSDIIEQCHNLLANCQGGWISGNPSCTTGHIGALCEQCDLYNIKGEGYYSSNQSYQCSNCDQSAQNILNIFFVVLWTLISVFITVTSTIKMIDDFVFQLKLKPLGFFTIIQSASTSILLKVFTNYLQIVSSIASFQLQMPIGITLAIRGVGNPIGSMAFSLDCYLKSVSSIPMLYFRVIWGFVIAGMYIFFFFLFHIISNFTKKQKSNITFVTTTLIYVYIYLSPNMVSELSFLISYRNASGQKWIAANVAYLYTTSNHEKWLLSFVTPTFLIIGILLPLFFWYIVYHHRFSLNNNKTRKFWGYLYNEYKQSVYYWETIKIIQKELIILILIYYEDYVAIKACLIFFLLHLYSKLTTKFKPYLTENLNQIDSLSTSICKFSIVIAQSIYLAQNLQITEVVWPFYFILAVINCFFIFEMISKLIFAYFDKLYEHIDKVKVLVFFLLPSDLKRNKFCRRLLQNKTERKQIIRQRFQLVRIYLINQAKLIVNFKKQNNMGLQASQIIGITRPNTRFGTILRSPTIKLRTQEYL